MLDDYKIQAVCYEKMTKWYELGPMGFRKLFAEVKNQFNGRN